MLRYIATRGIYSVFALFGVATVTFFAVFASGDPVLLMLPPGNQSEEEIELVRRIFGLDKPLWLQYVDFLWRGVRGDFGRSLRYDMPSMQLVMERLPATIELAVAAVLIGALIGIPLGILAASKKGSPLDGAIMIASTLGLSAPTFWIGTMAIVVFAVNWRIVPPSGRGEPVQLILPALTLATVQMPVLLRFTRSAMIDVLGREYIATAHAKGLGSRVVLYRHAFRNAMIPVVTLLGLEMGTLLGGAVITETVFAWPGIGQLVVNSVLIRDFPVVIAAVLTAAAMFVAINFLVDLLYMYINPTVRLR
jgi:peptide/nickel transport system permease protein